VEKLAGIDKDTNPSLLCLLLHSVGSAFKVTRTVHNSEVSEI
jgi:hypothetical protein